MMMDVEKKKTVRVRVEADPLIVELVATEIGEYLEGKGYEVVDQSVAYPNRSEPEKARVYLTLR